MVVLDKKFYIFKSGYGDGYGYGGGDGDGDGEGII